MTYCRGNLCRGRACFPCLLTSPFTVHYCLLIIYTFCFILLCDRLQGFAQLPLPRPRILPRAATGLLPFALPSPLPNVDVSHYQHILDAGLLTCRSQSLKGYRYRRRRGYRSHYHCRQILGFRYRYHYRRLMGCRCLRTLGYHCQKCLASLRQSVTRGFVT